MREFCRIMSWNIQHLLTANTRGNMGFDIQHREGKMVGHSVGVGIAAGGICRLL